MFWNTAKVIEQAQRDCSTTASNGLVCDPSALTKFATIGIEPCTVCSSDEYETTACSATSDRVCRLCTKCAAGQFENSKCSGTTNTKCSECSGPCKGGKGLYQSAACSAVADRVCLACSTCASDEFESAACDQGKDRVCVKCGPSCNAGEFEVQSCSGTSKRICRACSTCAAGTYQTTACTATSDTVCNTCSKDHDCTTALGSPGAKSNSVSLPSSAKPIEFVVINLDGSDERMDSIRNQFKDMGLSDQLRRFGTKRVLPVGSKCVSRYSDFRYLTPSEMDQIRLPPEERIAGTVGTFLSHYTIWGEIAHSTSPSIVLEDDAKLTPRLTDALDFISRTDLEYLNLGAEGFGIDCYRNQVHNPVMFPFTGPSTTSYDIACVKQSAPHNCGNYGGGNIAYYLTPIGAQRLLDLYTQKLMFVPADWFIIRCAESQPLADCKWRSMVPGVVERVEKIKSDRLQMEACYV
eukprot:c12637_g2_i1.p1 GENE.c12637_g2_i1~~c12637_g2_i1.p1  ORF type:complete len:465 (-),score=99.80 c12637_g2_i1:291-1685(-)